MNVYQENGYENRADYLKSLAENNGIDAVLLRFAGIRPLTPVASLAVVV